MYSVFLCFNVKHPESEDEAVKAYLDKHGLEPKMRGDDTVEGKEFEVMYFGGCYLGQHLKVVTEMQRTAVEQDMLAKEIEASLKAAADTPAREVMAVLAEPELKKIVADLVLEFYNDSSFGPDDEGYLKVTLAPDTIEQRFLEMASNKV